MPRKKTPTEPLKRRAVSPVKNGNPTKFDRGRETFLTHLAQSMNVTDSAKAADMAPSSVYRRRHEDPEFAKAWDEAMRVALDTAKGKMFERGAIGVLEPMVSGGKLVGSRRVYSDTLLLALVKAHDPNYQDKSKVQHSGSIKLESIKAEIAERERALAEQGIDVTGLRNGVFAAPLLPPTTH